DLERPRLVRDEPLVDAVRNFLVRRGRVERRIEDRDVVDEPDFQGSSRACRLDLRRTGRAASTSASTAGREDCARGGKRQAEPGGPAQKLGAVDPAREVIVDQAPDAIVARAHLSSSRGLSMARFALCEWAKPVANYTTVGRRKRWGGETEPGGAPTSDIPTACA